MSIEGLDSDSLQVQYAEQTWRDGGALAWVPFQRDHYLARFPKRDDHESWLKVVCRIRAPQKIDNFGRWRLARSTLNKMLRAGLDEYGSVGLFLDVEGKLAECDARCQNAETLDCVCGCLGENHGTGPDTIKWVEISNAELVWERGTTRRMFRLLTPYAVEGDAKVYDGELELIEYTENSKRRERDGWPRASVFLCSSCSTTRASVWDHCHPHGYVRAPLCGPCDTWHWAGWGYNVRLSKKADISYLKLCPSRFTGQCSA